MSKPRYTIRLLCCVILILIAGAATGQSYPNKPIRLVTGGVGGGADFVARLYAQGLSASVGQQVIVDNRASNISPQVAAKSPPDGYTLLVGTGGLWLSPFMQATTVDPLRDFATITILATSPFVVVVHPAVAAASIKELIALAKAKPGVLNYGAGSPGGITHVAAEVFKSMAGVDMVRIGYKSDALLNTDLLAGQVQLTFGSASSVMPHAKAGKLRALAVTSAQPSALLPGLPPVAATVPGYQIGSIYGLFAPATTPVPIIKQVHQESVRFLNTADAKERLLNAGVEAAPGTPEEFTGLIKSEMARIGKVIKEAGIRTE